MNAEIVDDASVTRTEEHAKEYFEAQRYVVAKGVLPKQVFEIFERYAILHLTGDSYFEFDEKTQSFGRYADALGESVLMQMKPIVERITGKRLVPTYSFLRYYSVGSYLGKHTDRDACEISATITIGFSGSEIWPIWLEARGMEIAVPLDVGDMLIYRGIDVPHWREQLEEGYWLQLFIHYIDAEGAHLDQRFDARDSLGPNNAWTEAGAERAEKVKA